MKDHMKMFLAPTVVRSDRVRSSPRARAQRLRLCVALLATIALATTARAATIYRQNFAANAGMTPFATFGWNAVYGNATTNGTVAPSGSSGNTAMVSGGPSAPTPGPNVNAANDPANATNNITKGFVPLLSPDGAQDFLVYTTAYAIDRATTTPATFQWYDGSYYAGDAQRLAVQVDGNWYAQTTSYQPPAFGSNNGGQGFGPAAQQVVAPFSTSGWVALDFALGSPLTLGPTTTLPDGPLTGFGVYAQIADDPTTSTLERTFFDTFEVTTAVPEPTSLAAFAGVAIACPRRRRARR